MTRLGGGRAWVATLTLLLAALRPGALAAQPDTEVSVIASVRDWGAALPAMQELQFAIRQATMRGAVLGRASRASRAGLSDERAEVEFYPTFRGGYAALGFAYAPDDTIYPRSVVSAEFFRSVAPRTEASVGYRRMDFASAVDIVTGSVGRYHGDYLFTLRATHILDDGTTGLLSARRYLGDGGTYLGAQLASGSGPVVILAPSDFESRFSRSLAIDGRWVRASGWALAAQFAFGREGLPGGGETDFTTGMLSIGRRF